MSNYHEAVMLSEAIEALQIDPSGRYVDATFGGGGHARAILSKLNTGRLIAFDRDEDALSNVPDEDRLTFINHNFRYMKQFLAYHQLIPVDGILADLGVSSHQINEAERGFSTRFEGPLDMRMSVRSGLSAADVVNKYGIEELDRVFRLYGELRQAHKIARQIVAQREKKSITTTTGLRDLLQTMAPPGRENKFMAQVFQSLRIEVNRELEALERFLEQSIEVLKEGGRLVVITYHSLEDRIVKHFMKTGNTGGRQVKDFYGQVYNELRVISRQQTPTDEEIKRNPRSRSARLRIAEKKGASDA